MSSLLEVKGLSRCVTTKTAKPQTKWLIQGRGVEESDPPQPATPPGRIGSRQLYSEWPLLNKPHRDKWVIIFACEVS